MRDADRRRAERGRIRELARRHGMITLRHDGFRKVREGITTIEEVLQTRRRVRE